MKKRSHYLLLEMIIAITVLSLVALPLIRSPITDIKRTILLLKESDLERVSEVTFASLIGSLPSILPFDEIPSSKTKATSIPLQEVEVSLVPLGSFRYITQCKIWSQKQKKDLCYHYHLLRIEITFSPKGHEGNQRSYQSQFLVKKAIK